jgi:uncharacterized protein YjiS (DUF1127 family)
MAAPDLSAYLKLGLGTLAMWRERSHQRCRLRELVEDQHLLCDTGLTKAEALAEASRPFWSPLRDRMIKIMPLDPERTRLWRSAVIASEAKQSRSKRSMIAVFAPGLLRRFFSKSAIADFAWRSSQ